MIQTFLDNKQAKDWLKASGSCEDVGDKPLDWLAETKSRRAPAVGVEKGSKMEAERDVGESWHKRADQAQEDKPKPAKNSDHIVREVAREAIKREAVQARGEGGVDARNIFREKVSPCTNLAEVLEILKHEKLGVLREIQDGAHNLVFTDGVEKADVLVIGEAPGRDEDRLGLPFVGRSGQLLDKMLGSVGLSRSVNVLLTNVVFWRPPGNRNPSDSEVLACSPVVEKIMELVNPKIILLTGAVPMQALLKSEMAIGRVRGIPQELSLKATGSVYDVLVTFHPSYLLRTPKMKAHAWRDMLMLQKMLAHRHVQEKPSQESQNQEGGDDVVA